MNAKQELFINEYLTNGFNASQAYLKVFKCAKSSASALGARYFNQPEVKEEVYKRQKELFEALSINAERIAAELAEIAFAPKGDKDYNTTAKLKALDLLQKQLSLQNQNVTAKVESNIINVNIETEGENEE